MANDQGNDTTDLFLIGKTGHGKSSTGNTILDREAFNVSDNTESETYDIQVGWARRLGRKVKVVDGPGLSETRIGRGEAAKKLVKDMGEGITQCPLGFHSLLLVLKYGNRFTEEELGTVKSLKSLFGETFVKDFCILIFTHGENFDMNNKKKKTNQTFEDWCHQQTGAIQSLFNECDYRAVLFYNIDEEKSDEQLSKLFKIVDGLKSKGKRYTNEAFQRVSQDREKLIVRENAQIIREEIQAKIDLLEDGVNKFKQCTELDENTRTKLGLLKKDAQDLEVECATRDKGTGVLQQLRQVVANILQNVESHAEVMRANLDKKQKEQALREVHQKYEQNLKQLRDEQKKRKRGWGSILGGIVKSVCSFFVSPALGIYTTVDELQKLDG